MTFSCLVNGVAASNRRDSITQFPFCAYILVSAVEMEGGQGKDPPRVPAPKVKSLQLKSGFIDYFNERAETFCQAASC